MRAPLPLALLLVAALADTTTARAQTGTPATVPPAESVHLANGLRVLLAPDPSAPLVSINVSYAAGLADDPNGRRGLARLAEHMAARCTRHVEDVTRTLESAGAWRVNATTLLTETKYFESVPPERLETALWLESDRMGYAASAVTKDAFVAERELVRGEDRLHAVDGTLTTAWASVQHELYPDWHPYSAGWDGPADLDSIGPEDVRAFLDTWYGPENATLAIAGRFDREKALSMVRRYFESLPSHSPPARPPLPQWTNPATRLAVVAPIPTDQVVLTWRTPAYGEKDDAALDLVAAILTERLSKTLVATHVATGARARQKSERGESNFYVLASAAPGVNPGVLIEAIQSGLDGLARDVARAEIDRARGRFRSSALASLETTWGRANRLASLAKRGIEPGPGFDWGFGQYDLIQETDVARAIVTWLGRARRVSTAIFSDRSAPGQGSLFMRDEEEIQ